jgi:hypothetical protein
MADDERPVPSRSTSPRPLGGLGDLAELLGGDSERSRKFLGGIAVGAMVGAAIAGAAVMRRRRAPGDDRGPKG